MILNNNKYIKFMNILFAVGFSTIFSYAQNFSYETSNENLSYINKYASSYVDLRIDKKVNIQDINSSKTKEELIDSISKEGNTFVTIKINEL